MTQVYNKVPPPIRKNASNLFIWGTADKKELDWLCDEHTHRKIPKEAFQDAFDYFTAHDHGFLHIYRNLPADKQLQLYRKGFFEILNIR